MVSSDSSTTTDVVAQLCVDYWQLLKSTRSGLQHTDSVDKRRLEGQLKFSERQLQSAVDQLGLQLVDLEGESFHPGLPVSPVNADDYDEDVALVIAKTFEPTITKEMKVVRKGRVLLEPATSTKE